MAIPVGTGMERLAAGQWEEAHEAGFPLPEDGGCPGVVPSLALSQQSPEISLELLTWKAQ